MTLNSALHIAFLTPEFVTEKKFDGGLANYLNRVTRMLADAGHKPEVFVISDRDETIDYAGVPVHRLSHAYSRMGRLAYRAVRKACHVDLRMTSEVLRASRALKQQLMVRHQENRFDLVQASDFYATGLCVPLHAGFPLVTRLSYYSPAWRQAYALHLTRDRQWMEQLEARALRRSHFCYAPSSAIAKLAGHSLGLDVDIVHPPAFIDVPKSLDTQVLPNDLVRRKRYVLFFGRVCRLKGVYTLAEAMAKVLAENTELHLVIVGREDPPGIIDELRDILGAVAGRLMYFPRLQHAQLFPIIRGAEVVVLPSRIDNFPNTCMEAMALEKPIIGTRETGFDDLISDGYDGFLVPKDDAEALAARIRFVTALPEETRAEIGHRAARRIADFSADRVLPQLLQYYRRCISGVVHARESVASTACL